MAKSEKIRRWIAGLFLVLFVGYYANATLFEHCHVINGVTIVHSHIHNDSHTATPSGGHSATDVTLIAQLNSIQCGEAGATLCNLEPFNIPFEIIEVAVPVTPQTVYLTHHNLRAPPML